MREAKPTGAAGIFRLMQRLAHMLAALLLLAFAAGFAVGCGDEDDSPPTDPSGQTTPGNDPPADEQPAQQDLAKAGIDPITGAYQGLEPDTREGTPPPDPAGSLAQAAQKAGCTLRLG